MRIIVDGEVTEGRSGVCVRARRLHLAAHGCSVESATRSLERTVRAWAVSLSGAGMLDEAVRRTGVHVGEGGDDIAVEVRAASEETRP